MAYKFDTYTQLGEAIKKAKPEYADRNSESLGLQFSEKYGDKYSVNVAEEEDRATFAFDPEKPITKGEAAGENILKTLGNFPSGAVKVVEGLATAVMNPLDTAEALGRGVAGGAELALGTQFSPKNIQIAEQLGEGLVYDAGFETIDGKRVFTGRGIIENPLNILSLLAGGTAVGAKGASMGARALSKAGKTNKQGQLLLPQQATGEAGRAARFAEKAERVGSAAQRLDPTLVLPSLGFRAGKATAKGAGKIVGAGARRVARPVIAPIKNFTKDKVDRLNSLLEDSPYGTRLREIKEKYSSLPKTGLDKIKGFKEKAVEKTQEQIEKTVGEKGSLRGTLEGLLFNTLSFTWNLPERLVRKVVNTATNDSKQTGVILNAIRQGDEVVNGRKVSGDAIVSRKLASNITEAIQEYRKNQTKIQDERRKLLHMDKITVGVQDFRNGLQNLIKNDFQFKENMLGQVIPEFRPFFGETGQKGVVNALESLYDPRFNDGFITLEQLDKFKQLVGDLRYGKDGPTTNATRVLDDIYAYTRDYIGKVADDPITMNAHVMGLRKQKVKEGLQRDIEAGYKDPQIRRDILESLDVFGELGAGGFDADIFLNDYLSKNFPAARSQQMRLGQPIYKKGDDAVVFYRDNYNIPEQELFDIIREGRDAFVKKFSRSKVTKGDKAGKYDDILEQEKLRDIERLEGEFAFIDPDKVESWAANEKNILKEFYGDADTGEFPTIELGDYSLAMREHMDFQDFMKRLSDDLRIKTPDSRRRIVVDEEGKAVVEDGSPVFETILKQPGKEREVLRSVLNAFDDDTGLAFETLAELSEVTNRPEMISQVLGANLRPTLATGLAPRGEISQLSRTAAGGLTHPLAVMVTLVEFFPALAVFSPKYGSQLLIRAYSPEGRKVLNNYTKMGAEGLAEAKRRGLDAWTEASAWASKVTGKKRKDLTDNDVFKAHEDAKQLESALEQMPPDRQSLMRTILQGGAITARAEEQGEEAQERRNLLSTLGQTQR